VVSTGSTTRVPWSRRARPPGAWSRRARPAGSVSTGSTTRVRWSRRARLPANGLDHPRTAL